MAGFNGRATWTVGILAAAAVAVAAWFGASSGGAVAPAANTAAKTAAPGLAANGAKPVAGGKQHAPAGKPIDKVTWKDLSPAQQLALEPLSAEWDKLEKIRKQKWLDIANRYSSMTPDEQGRVHERMREWVMMTPEQRRQVRQNFARAQKIQPGQKSAQWEEYQQLPEEQKKKLAEEAAVKKQVANLPTPAQSKMKTVAPIKPGAGAVAPAAGPASAGVNAAPGAPTATPGAATPAGATPTPTPAAPAAVPAPAPAANASNVLPTSNTPASQVAPVNVK